MSHSPEPWHWIPDRWKYPAYLLDAKQNCVLSTGQDEERCPSPDDAQRIVAAVNFCKEFSTEFLKAHQLVYLHDESDLRATPAAGFVAAKMLPVKATVERGYI